MATIAPPRDPNPISWILKQDSSIPQGIPGKQLSAAESESVTRWLGQRQHGVIVTLRNLISVLKEEAENEENTTLPTEYAIDTVASIIADANSRMRGNFPQGSPSADGTGGLRVEWIHGEREIRLAVAPRSGGKTYIYHEEPAHYATEYTVSAQALAKWLDWLIEA